MRFRVILTIFLIFLYMMSVECLVDFACTVLCTQYWSCVVRSIGNGKHCNAPHGCECRKFAL